MDELTREKKIITKCKFLGLTEFDFDGASYVIDGSEVLLKEVYITDGEFTIPEFVTGIFDQNLKSADFYNSPFINCKSIKVINHSPLKNMRRMFRGCHELISLDLSEFDTSKVTDMGEMFSWCTLLDNIDLSGFDTSSVTDMNRLFYHCESLSTLKFDFDTHNVKRMDEIFSCCFNLEHLSLNFDMRKVSNMNRMFSQCEKLKRLSLNFDTQNLLTMDNMFGECLALEELELGDRFVIPSCTVKSGLIFGCGNLKRIIMKGMPICSE